MTRKIRIAVLGVGFDASFAEICGLHPDVEYAGICAHESAMKDGEKVKIRLFAREGG